MFRNHEESHAHSLETLNSFYKFDDFMESIGTVADLGCGNGLDLEWWATRTTRDDDHQPLNIHCTGIDINSSMTMQHAYKNVTFQCMDFEENNISTSGKFDLLWSHDSFQYCINPIATLSKWWHATSPGGMLALVFPQTTNIEKRKFAFTQNDGCYYHHSLVSIIHMLTVSGWDCTDGFFLKKPTDNWLHAIAYKSDHTPMNPKTTRWYDLVDKNLLPESAKNSVMRHGYLDQRDLVLPWLDRNLTWYGK